MKQEILSLLKSSPFDYFFNPAARVFWVYLLSSGLISIVFFYASLKKNNANKNVPVGFSKTEPKKELQKYLSWKNQKQYWFSAASILDYKYFFVIWFLKAYIVTPFIVSGENIAINIITTLNYFNAPLFLQWNKTVIAFFYTTVLFVFSDFTRYWLHRWFHQNHFLWQFHKVHHSAESLNPFTFYRTHPVENFLFGMRYAMTAGFVTGIFLWAFGANLSLASILGGNIFTVVFSLVGTNLRHSPVKLAYPNWLENYFISPSQHQLHHDVYFSRKNYGGYLAIWDNMFGSLLKTKEVEREYKFGFFEKEKITAYTSIKQLLFTPFVDVYILLKLKIKSKVYRSQTVNLYDT